MMKYAPSAPMNGANSNSEPSTGPTDWGNVSPVCSSATPLPTRRGGTMSATYARRDGPVKAKHAPKKRVLTVSQITSIRPIRIRNPISA